MVSWLVPCVCLVCSCCLPPSLPPSPCAAGAFRAAYRSVMHWEGDPGAEFVCKFAKDPSTSKSMYFNDVEAHEIAALYANQFNESLPAAYPRIQYVPAFVV